MRLFVEHVHECCSNNLTFLLGIFDTCQTGKEKISRIHTDHVQAEFLVILKYIREFVFPQQTIVHENTSQILTDSPV